MMDSQKKDYENQLKVKDAQRLKEKKIMKDYQESLRVLQEKHKISEEKIKFESRAELMETIKKNEEKTVDEISDEFAKRFGLKKV